MAEADGLIVYDEEFARDVARYAQLSGKSFEDELKNQARLWLQGMVKVTPPFHAGATASQAKKSGERKIAADLRRIFAPVELKGVRPERYPDVEAIYRDRKDKAKGRGGIGLRFARERLFVDESKVAALEATLQKRVGFLGGGYSVPANALGATLPGFMKRHMGAPGTVEMIFREDWMRISIVNRVEFASRIPDLKRRAEWVLLMRKKAMERQLPYLIRKHERVLN